MAEKTALFATAPLASWSPGPVAFGRLSACGCVARVVMDAVGIPVMTVAGVRTDVAGCVSGWLTVGNRSVIFLYLSRIAFSRSTGSTGFVSGICIVFSAVGWQYALPAIAARKRATMTSTLAQSLSVMLLHTFRQRGEIEEMEGKFTH